ncbi:MAG: V-type ATP synthase subunit A [Turneriella sp.]
MTNEQGLTRGKITGVLSNLVSIEADGPIGQNEICHIEVAGVKLMAEVIRVTGNVAQAQVFESTRGIRKGDAVTFSGHMLEISLGPGLLSRKYDGLQNDLDKLQGLFLARGQLVDPLDAEAQYEFNPHLAAGSSVEAGTWLGEVKEGWIAHQVMVPFALTGRYTIKSIVAKGKYRVDEEIAVLTDAEGVAFRVTMRQKWPVKRAITAYKDKPRPFKLLEMGIRAVDTLNPMPEGGSGFIPGPFGCGKTVLQHAMSKNANADLIIITACGERANEVVEIFKEFPELDDPRTGRKLMERTTIICNTSNMPVAAREASVYTGMTIAEYYRAMGLKVLLLADSTSRWAQALREMSNRLEELPGPDAFPMDLSAVISAFYARAGFVTLKNGKTGSVTFVGTVSPAGGNMNEPVTEGTRKAARCYYALAQKRADSKRYPAIDPLDSYSKYLDYPEFRESLARELQPGWAELVEQVRDVLRRSVEANDQIAILGDDSVPISYHITLWKGELVDFTILQQDAFDKIDQSTPMERQKYMLNLVAEICNVDFHFAHFEDVGTFFKKLINLAKQMNYSEFGDASFKKYEAELRSAVEAARPAAAAGAT